MQLEQEFSFFTISNRRFGQQSYEGILQVLKIPEMKTEIKNKIESLAEHIRDGRAEYYARIAFWISCLFAPLALTSALFSGTHLLKDFANDHHVFSPAHWQPAGWIQFGIFYLLISSSIALLWVVIRIKYTKETLLKWFKKQKN